MASCTKLSISIPAVLLAAAYIHSSHARLETTLRAAFQSTSLTPKDICCLSVKFVRCIASMRGNYRCYLNRNASCCSYHNTEWPRTTSQRYTSKSPHLAREFPGTEGAFLQKRSAIGKTRPPQIELLRCLRVGMAEFSASVRLPFAQKSSLPPRCPSGPCAGCNTVPNTLLDYHPVTSPNASNMNQIGSTHISALCGGLSHIPTKRAPYLRISISCACKKNPDANT